MYSYKERIKVVNIGLLPHHAKSQPEEADVRRLRRVSASSSNAALLGCVILVRMLIALLGGLVANFPALWYDKFNKLESVMH